MASRAGRRFAAPGGSRGWTRRLRGRRGCDPFRLEARASQQPADRGHHALVLAGIRPAMATRPDSAGRAGSDGRAEVSRALPAGVRAWIADGRESYDGTPSIGSASKPMSRRMAGEAAISQPSACRLGGWRCPCGRIGRPNEDAGIDALRWLATCGRANRRCSTANVP
jgi:hypothetical protein